MESDWRMLGDGAFGGVGWQKAYDLREIWACKGPAVAEPPRFAIKDNGSVAQSFASRDLAAIWQALLV